MARIKKFGDTRSERLTTFQTFLVDENPNSTYFRISEFKDTFSGGKNGFLIEGSEFLKETTEIKIEILDVEGNPIYFEPGDGIPEYYEGISKLISVHIYEDTPIGIGKITILGELKNYLDNGDVIRPVPDDWKGLYNVKWERNFKINRLLSNEDKVRFYRRPEITIEEISRPIFTATPIEIQQTGIVNGLPIIPTAGTRLTDFSLPTSYLLTIADNSNWTASVVGNPIVLPNLGVQLQSTDVITNKQLSVSTPYTVDGIVQPFFNQPYTASFNYLELDSAIGTALSGSFGKITITDLTTFVGDVARVKVFRKSQSEVSDFQFVQEIPLESNEILIDLESSQRNQELYGLFTPFVIENYWVTSSNNLAVDFNQNFLYNSVKLDSIGTNKFFSVKEVPTNVGIEYTFGFNVRLEQNLSTNNSILIYLEGTRNGITTRQLITTIQSSNSILQKTNITSNFIAEQLDNAKLYFEVTGNGWYISDVSLRASQESSFSPDEITFIQPVPRTLETETFDFRFEFYDINNNFIPVLVEKTQTFNGGNLNRIAKSLELSPSSLYFQFDSGSGIGNPLPPTAIFIDVVKQFLTGSTNFTSRSFDLDNNELSASAYVGEQYPGLLIDEGADRFRLTVENFTGSKEDTIVQYIEYVAECEGVSDTIVITRVSDGKGGVNFEIRPYRGTVIRNKDELSTLEVQAVRIDGINEINLVSGLPLNQSDTKLFVQSGSNYLTITEASSSGFLKGVRAGTTGSGQLDYNPVFNRDSVVGQLVLYLIPSSSVNRADSIVSTLTLTDILDGLDAGFIEYDIDVFTINPRTEVVFTPLSASVTASYYRRGTTENPISASVIVYPSMSINTDFVPEFWLNYRTGSVNSDIVITGFNELGNLITPILPSNFVGNPLFQNKQLTLSFNYIEPYTSESVLVDHTFNIIPEGIPGQDAIVVELTPSTVVLSADENGDITDFSPSQTEIKVKQGADYLRFQSQRQAGTFFLSNASIVSEGINSGSTFTQIGNNNSVFITAASEFTLDIGTVTYPIEIRPLFTSSFFTQSISQSYTKVYDGANARSVTLIATTNVVNYDGNGNVVSPDGDITLTATAFNTTGSAHFQFFKNGTTLTPPTSINFGGDVYVLDSGFAASPGETSTFRVQLRDGSPDAIVSGEAQISITGIQSAAETYNVLLTNDNTSVVSSVFDVLTLSGSGTDIIATKGVEALTAVTSFSSPNFDQLGNLIPNGEYLVKIASKPAYITLAGGLVSSSTVPVVGDIARIGDVTGWTTPKENPTAQIVYEVNLEDGRQTIFKTQSLSIQFEGETGPGIVFRGEWTGSIDYLYNVAVRRRDAVLRNVDDGVHYWATTEQLVTASSAPFTSEPVYNIGSPPNPGDIDAGGWEYLGEQDLFVAAKIAIFEESFVKNTINVGNNPDSAFANIVIAGGRIDPYIAVGQNGTVGLSGDQTGSGIIGYDRPGIFMGTFDSASIKTPRFSLKNGAGDRFLRWDGANLDIQGSINITGGQAQTDINNSFASASNALLNAQDSGSSALDAARASGSVRPNTQRISKLAVPTDGNGLYLGSNNLGYYADGGWKTYMASNGDFFLTGSGGGFLEWNSSTSNLNIAGSINITGGQAQTDINNSFASASNALANAQSSGSAALNAAAASGSVNPSTQQITKAASPVGDGLYLGSNNLGYYAGGNWKTYMASNGDFFLSGAGSNGLTWNSAASTLAIDGNGTFSGTITASAGFIGGWTIDATELSKTTSGNKISLDSANNQILLTEGADVRFSVTTNDSVSIIPSSTYSPGPRGVFINRAGFAVGRDNQRYFRNVTIGEAPIGGKSFVFNDTKGGFRCDILTFHTPVLSDTYFKYPISASRESLDNDAVLPFRLVAGVPDTDRPIWMPRTQEAIMYDRPGDPFISPGNPLNGYLTGSQTWNQNDLQSGGGTTIGGTTFRVHVGTPVLDTVYGTEVQRLGMKINETGIIFFPSLPNGTASFINSTGQLASSSDRNLKIDDGFVENAIDKVLRLKPRYFYWKDTKLYGSDRNLGFYAQEVNEISSETSPTPLEGAGWGIYDRGLIAILTKAIQEQQEIIEGLKKDIDELKSKI